MTSTRAVRIRSMPAVAVVTTSAVGVVALGWPLLAPDLASSHSVDAPWVFLALVGLLMLTVLAELADGALDAKSVALLGVLAGIGAAVRPLSGGATGFSFEFFLLVLAARALGAGFGFVLGSLTLLASALLTGGVGPWLPFQMLCSAWIGLGAGLLPAVRGRAEVWLLASYGAVTGLAYGFVMNLSFWPFAHYYPHQIAFLPHASVATNLLHWWRFEITTSLGFDVPRAIGNALLIAALGRPVLTALQRVTRKAAIDARPSFVDTPAPADLAPVP